jgi:hypothetical protein
MLAKQVFEVSTLDYERDKRLVEDLMGRLQWSLHEENMVEIGEPSEYMGWMFFTVSIDELLMGRMAAVYESFLHAKGNTYYEKFEEWLKGKLVEAGSKARVKTLSEFTGLF